MTSDGEPELDAWLRRGYTLAEARRILQWARRERARLSRFAGPTKRSVEGHLKARRHAKELVRGKLKQLYGHQPLNVPKLLMASLMKRSSLLSDLLPNRERIWVPIGKRRHRQPLPEVNLSNFSFVDNPIGTIEKLSEVLRTEATEIQARLNFDDHWCLDIGAYLVLQALRTQMVPIYNGGVMNENIQKVIDAVGLREALNMAPFSVRDHNDVWPFHLQLRRPRRSRSVDRFLEPQTQEKVADRFVDAVNEWLALVAKRQLTSAGRRLVKKIMGEALNNAERHSLPDSDDGDWAVAGYLAREKSQAHGEVYKCYLAFLSIGCTIAESIAGGPAQTVANMNDYVAKHRGRHFDEEALRTIFALQDGVTRKHDALEEHRGGTGFQDIMEFFTELGDAGSQVHKAKMVVVSGSTCIRLSEPYMSGVQKAGLYSERELWFNRDNDPNKPPSLDHVLHLPAKLHGTLVSMVFAVDREYLEAKANANH